MNRVLIRIPIPIGAMATRTFCFSASLWHSISSLPVMACYSDSKDESVGLVIFGKSFTNQAGILPIRH